MNTPDQNQRLMQTQRQLAYIKSEMNGSINTIRIRDNAVLLIDILEYLFFGTATAGDPNFVPGTPASSLEDTRATRVEFTSGPGAVAAAEANRQRQFAASQPFSPTLPAFQQAPAPAEPVRNGDIQFVRTAPPSASVTFGAANPSGQRTEYFDAQGRPVNAEGQLIDTNGKSDPGCSSSRSDGTVRGRRNAPERRSLLALHHGSTSCGGGSSRRTTHSRAHAADGRHQPHSPRRRIIERRPRLWRGTSGRKVESFPATI